MTPHSEIVIDASCDFSSTFLEQHDIKIIPTLNRVADRVEIDTGDLKLTHTFYQSIHKDRIKPLLAYGQAEQAIIWQAIDRIVRTKSSHLTILTASEHFSIMHLLIRDITYKERGHIVALRKKLGIDRPLKIKVLDSNCILSGYGLVAFEAIRQSTEKALPAAQLPALLAKVSNRVDTQVSISSFNAFEYLCSQHGLTSKLNQKFSWLQQKKFQMTGQCVTTVLSQKKFYATTVHADPATAHRQLFADMLSRIKNGQYLPRINISIAANRSEIRTHQSLNQFIKDAQNAGAKVTVNMMSISGLALVGRNAIAVSAVKA